MEIHEIRYFLALAETLNFTRAAEQCNVSQPALTRAIKNLEDKLGGGPLVHRERSNTHLTELGRIMQPYFQHMLSEMQAAKEKARSYVKMTSTSLRVGLMCTIGPPRLVNLIANFGRNHPGVEINLVDGPVPMIEEQLEKGALDVGIFCRPEAIDDRFHALPLFRERFMVAVSPDHRLANREAVSIRDLDQEAYIGRAACEYYDYLRRIRLELGSIEFRRPYSSERDDWAQCMVLAGLGFTYIPEHSITVPGLTIVPLVDPEVWRTVQLVTVRGRPHTPAVGAFLRDARRHAWAGKVAPAENTSLAAE